MWYYRYETSSDEDERESQEAAPHVRHLLIIEDMHKRVRGRLLSRCNGKGKWTLHSMQVNEWLTVSVRLNAAER